MNDKPAPDRREFMIQTGATLAAASLFGQAARGQNPLAENKATPFEPVRIPDWVRDVTRMAFVGSGDIQRAVKAGAQVIHTNLVWPYYPLRKEGGGYPKRTLRSCVTSWHSAITRGSSSCWACRRSPR